MSDNFKEQYKNILLTLSHEIKMELKNEEAIMSTVKFEKRELISKAIKLLQIADADLSLQELGDYMNFSKATIAKLKQERGDRLNVKTVQKFIDQMDKFINENF